MTTLSTIQAFINLLENTPARLVSHFVGDTPERSVTMWATLLFFWKWAMVLKGGGVWGRMVTRSRIGMHDSMGKERMVGTSYFKIVI